LFKYLVADIVAEFVVDVFEVVDVEDGQRFTELLGHEIAQQRWLCHGFCLLEDHYHLLIETPEPTLARGMARLNMTYSQWFGRRHARRGHLFEGRYHTKIIEKDAWLLALSRHIVLNPVRLNAANRADLWRWSSYRPLAGAANPWPWLHTDWVLSQFTDDPHQQWQDYVEQGISAPSPWRELRGGHYLGSEPFLRKLALMVNGKSLDQVPSAGHRFEAIRCELFEEQRARNLPEYVCVWRPSSSPVTGVH